MAKANAEKENEEKVAKTVSELAVTPAQLKEHLDQYIEGQDHAKRVISVAVYNHYKMLRCKLQDQAIHREYPVYSGRCV